MISSEVQRTLVKSPPELWAEISDPEALARHLGEFGEIRITRVQPEQKVEWEAPEASGSIVIKPSGWGTKVKLTVTRELSEPDTPAEPDQTSAPGQATTIEPAQEVEAATAPELESKAELEPEPHYDERHDELQATEAELLADELLAEELLAEEQLEDAELLLAASVPLDRLGAQGDGDPQPETAGESDAQPQLEPEAAPARRRGFFARLFGRRHAARTATDEPGLHTPAIAEEELSDPALDADQLSAPDEVPCVGAEAEIDLGAELDEEPAPTPAAPHVPVSIAPATPAAAKASEQVDHLELGGTVEHPSPSDADANIAAELEQAEEAAEERVTAVLTGVLDRLGAAHHRPFSRA